MQLSQQAASFDNLIYRQVSTVYHRESIISERIEQRRRIIIVVDRSRENKSEMLQSIARKPGREYGRGGNRTRGGPSGKQNPITRVPGTFIGSYITGERQPEDIIILRIHLYISISEHRRASNMPFFLFDFEIEWETRRLSVSVAIPL